MKRVGNVPPAAYAQVRFVVGEEVAVLQLRAAGEDAPLGLGLRYLFFAFSSPSAP
jgi:hypothetical protein